MLICLEGIDGSGKATQSRLLQQALIQRYGAQRVTTLSFPRYGESFFAAEVAAYLNGERGSLENVHPHFSAVLFAGDRFEAKPFITAALEQGNIIVCDRYVASNTAHQGARLPAARRHEFYRWNERLEYEVYGMPRADLTLFIDTPPDVAWEMVAQKAARDYTDKQRDIQEAKADYLHEVYAVYSELAKEQNWPVIQCVQDGVLRLPEVIAGEIYEYVSVLLERRC